ncbi:MAG: hypothetical protein WC238_01780 [Parcubacteria group bacterium]|jgi:hypothetical protein
MGGFEIPREIRLTPDEIEKRAASEKRRKIVIEDTEADDAVSSLQKALDDAKVTTAQLEGTGVLEPKPVFKASKEGGKTNPGEFESSEDAIDNLFKRRN